MINFKPALNLLSVSFLLIPFSAIAESWSCRHTDDVREIHIVTESSAPVPCSVVYKKLTEGVEDQVLWTANNDANYCEEKAKAFVAKQESWGWTCVETISNENSSDDATTEEQTTDAPAETDTQPAETDMQ